MPSALPVKGDETERTNDDHQFINAGEKSYKYARNLNSGNLAETSRVTACLVRVLA